MIHQLFFRKGFQTCLYGVLFLFFVLSCAVFAQNEDLQSTVEYKVSKMKTELNLTDTQASAIKPILKDYMFKHAAILKEVEGQGIVDHVAVKSTLKGLKKDEYQKLSKVLNEDQMKKWVNKENLMAALNPDGMESSVDDGPTLTANGADFKF